MTEREKSVHKVSPEELRKLQELVVRQRSHATSLGVLRVEYLERESFWLRKVNETSDLQDKTGDGLLRLHGIDPNDGEWTIDMVTGAIKFLHEGKWIEKEERQNGV